MTLDIPEMSDSRMDGMTISIYVKFLIVDGSKTTESLAFNFEQEDVSVDITIEQEDIYASQLDSNSKRNCENPFPRVFGIQDSDT